MAKGSYFGKQRSKGSLDRIELPKVNLTAEQIEEFAAGKLLLIDKDVQWTSFDVIRKIRNMIRIKKIGHAGTLDPLASGLLIICTGKYTKKINEYMKLPKEYTGSFTLGNTTATYDLESEPENPMPVPQYTLDQLQQATEAFTGEILQKPPVYSAIKKEGVAAYELARRGEDIDLQPRPVVIYEFEITGLTLPVIHFRVKCSTGTYIRSLAHDFGRALGCGAYLSGLRRTKVGDYKIEEAQTLLAFANSLHAPTAKTDNLCRS